MPRQNAIASILMMIAFGGMLYLFCRQIAGLFLGGAWDVYQYMALANLAVMYITVFGGMTKAPVSSWKALGLLLISPLIVLLLWVGSMELAPYYMAYGHSLGDDQIGLQIAMGLGFYVIPFWPILLFAFGSKILAG